MTLKGWYRFRPPCERDVIGPRDSLKSSEKYFSSLQIKISIVPLIMETRSRLFLCLYINGKFERNEIIRMTKRRVLLDEKRTQERKESSIRAATRMHFTEPITNYASSSMFWLRSQGGMPSVDRSFPGLVRSISEKIPTLLPRASRLETVSGFICG